MGDISQLATISSKAVSLANLILVTPQTNVGIAAQLKSGATESFLFDYEGENSVVLDNDITDHYIENNTSIQDHVAQKPEVINTTGYVGELNDIVPKSLAGVKKVADKLVLLSPFTPKLSVTALIAFNTASQINATATLVANAAVSAWGSLTGGSKPVQTKQQAAFSKFYGYWKNRQLFTVQTPWGTFNDMQIKTMRAVQDEETRMISSFEMSFKRMRFAKTQTTGNKTPQNRLLAQASSVVNKGTSTPGQAPITFASTVG